MGFTKNIPNFLTLINLSLGAAAIFLGRPGLLLPLMIIASLADFLDGATARWFKAASPIGKELDSLADLITFGVAPAWFFAQIVGEPKYILMIPWLIYIAGAALRLARYNISESGTDFSGCPSPAMGLFLGGIIHASYSGSAFVLELVENQFFMILLPLILALLMNIELRYFSLKGNKKGIKGAFFIFIILIALIAAITVDINLFVPNLFGAYIFFGLFSSFLAKKFERE
jgi:CDP-diacylglycerol--serine O-phosphatidyltransferase